MIEENASRIAEVSAHADTGGLDHSWQNEWEVGMILLLFPPHVECFLQSFDA